MLRLTIAALSSLLLFSCTSLPGNHVKLIEAPEVVQLAKRKFDYKPHDQVEVAYATDRRKPKDASGSASYADDRGEKIWLGFASLDIERKDDTGRIHLKEVRESGVLKSSVGNWDHPPSKAELDGEAEFFRQLNRKLDATKKKDLVIYLSGFRMPFSDPLLVSGQLSSLATDNLVFLGYSWPTTPSWTSYLRDLESAEYSSRSLRLLLRELAAKSHARRIHLFAYSAGTRLAARTLHEINLESGSESVARQRYRLGQVALVSSDMDRQLFGSFLADGITRACEHLLVYRSSEDDILGLSGWLFGRGRLGHVPTNENYPLHQRKYLRDLEKLDLVDVSSAPLISGVGGHFYFYKSPWVSSDLLLSFISGLPPARRGLVRDEDGFTWNFPNDYPQRLEALSNRGR